MLIKNVDSYKKEKKKKNLLVAKWSSKKIETLLTYSDSSDQYSL